jgi:hypothetical protein
LCDYERPRRRHPNKQQPSFDATAVLLEIHMATLKLICSVIDESSKSIGLPPFGITIAQIACVYDLVEPIRTECGPQVLHSDICIWKPKSMLPEDDHLSRFIKGLHLDILSKNDSADWLTSTSTLESHFTAPLPSGYIHILAQLIDVAKASPGHKGRP